jgi:hypothetical protein
MTPADEDLAVRAAEEALSILEVEREERPDGRHLLYFRWPTTDDPAAVPDGTQNDV